MQDGTLTRNSRSRGSVLHVVGARPNFVKAAPVVLALRRAGVSQLVVHTGQHFSPEMSQIFLDQLGLGNPDYHLEVKQGSHAVQTAEIMVRLEKVLQAAPAEIALVYGDVNSAMAAALVCAKLNLPVGHIEAGLRSRDRSMPEEINRIVTDHVADLHFTPSADGDANLIQEGIPEESIFRVGNLMIDSLIRLKKSAIRPPIDSIPERFALVTLHRPGNVDDPESLRMIADGLVEISRQVPVLFPVHPRTKHRLEGAGLELESDHRLRLLPPLGYLEFLWLQERAQLVITDSGGIQEETTFLGVPCLTVRENTERPVTVSEGTNTLVGTDMASLLRHVNEILAGRGKQGRVPDLWDGHAGDRVADVLRVWLADRP